MSADQSCVLLFGSLARGDSSSESDIDILIAAPQGRLASVKDGPAEIQHTPQEKLLEMAKNGDLFAIHLAYEARVISDPSNFFQEFKALLVIRKEYHQERRWAFSLLSYLMKKRVARHHIQLRNVRIAWCVRTILISLLIEEGRIIFSPIRLAQHYPDPYIKKLLSLRRGTFGGRFYRKDIETFLTKFNGKDYFNSTVSELEHSFNIEENQVALATLKSFENGYVDGGKYVR